MLDVAPTSTPGTTYVYSDLNLITLGVLLERQTGSSLDRLVAQRITGPLGMKDTGYNPDPSLKPRIAATEFQSAPARGMVWGEVHDENAWSLGGVAGHAGVFSTAQDMAVLSQAMLNGGTYGGDRILSPSSVEAMTTNYNVAFPDDAHGLGFELDQRWYMSGLSGPRTAGHTGYTGTSVVIDFASRSFVDRAVQPGAPEPQLGQQQPGPPGGGAGARPRPGGPAAARVPPRGSAARRTPPARPSPPARSTCHGRRRCRSTCSSTPSPPTRSPWRPRATAAGRGPRCRSGSGTAAR